MSYDDGNEPVGAEAAIYWNLKQEDVASYEETLWDAASEDEKMIKFWEDRRKKTSEKVEGTGRDIPGPLRRRERGI